MDIISVTLNDTGAERTGTITYTAGDSDPVIVTVTQLAQDTLTAEPTTIYFDSTGTPAQTITVATSADTFTTTASDAWITIVEGDGEFTVTLAENTGEVRSGTITVNAGTANEVIITITQESQDLLAVVPPTQTVDYNDQSVRTYTLSTTADSYSATSTADWINISQGVDSFTVNAISQNITGTARTAIITVTAETATPVTVEFVQNAQDTLTVDPINIEFSALLGLSVDVNFNTTAETILAVSNDDWLTVVQLGGVLVVTALTNLTGEVRVGTITVNAGTADEVTITVTQAAQVLLNVTPTALTFSYEGSETQSVDVSTSGELYTATPSEDWITVTVDPVADTFHVEVEPHEGQYLRMAMITVNDDLENEQAVSVEQLFPPFTHKIEIDLSKEVMRFSPDSTWETQTTEILTAVDYDDLVATSDDNWITCEIVNVSGRYEVKVSCVPNTKDNETGGLERTGYVYVETLSGNGYPAKLTVIQGKKW